MEDYCVCCGRIVPEGQQVCPVCEAKVNEEGRRKSGSPSFRRWFHDFRVVARTRRDDRCLHRHRAARDLLSE